MLLIDSSSIVKFFSKEPGWQKAKNYVGESITIQLAIVELCSALSRKTAKKEIKENTAIKLLKDYSEKAILLDQRKYIESAFKISIGNNISVYDSFFIAAALEEGYNLVSSDEKQSKIAENLGIKVIKC